MSLSDFRRKTVKQLKRAAFVGTLAAVVIATHYADERMAKPHTAELVKAAIAETTRCNKDSAVKADAVNACVRTGLERRFGREKVAALGLQ
jgi:hypothetical protein